MPAYAHVFHFGHDDLARMAYYFRYDHPQLESARRAGEALDRFVAEWLQRHERGDKGELVVERRDDTFLLNDSRFTRETTSSVLDRDALVMLLACDRPVSRSTALARAARNGQTTEDVAVALDSLLERGAIVQAGNLLVTVACLPDAVRESAADLRSLFTWPVMLTSRAISEGVVR
jgi:hypothetical protein